MQVPNEPSAGEPVSFRWGVQVVRCLRELYALHRGLKREPRHRAEAEPFIEQWPFQGYRSAYTGGGVDPPEDQPFRLRVRLGVVKNLQTLVPSNCSHEFVVPPNKVHFFYLRATFAEGGLESVSIAQGETVPDDEPVESGVGGLTHCALFRATTGEDGITQIEPLRKSSLEVHPVVTEVECETNTVEFAWS